jgi:subtilisin family serine protease/flagellar hook assembly protein FlgD
VGGALSGSRITNVAGNGAAGRASVARVGVARIGIAIGLVLVLASGLAVPRPAAAAGPIALSTAADAGRAILVRLAPGTGAADAAELWQEAGVARRGGRSRLGVQVVLAPSAPERAAARARLAADPRVVYAEPDRIVQAAAETAAEAAAAPNDPLVPAEWWLDAVDVAPAWEYVGLREPIVAAVLDSGVALDHPDLAGVLVPGINLVEPDRPPADDHGRGHGTHVTGILAAATNNGLGVAGVGWGTRVMPVKVLDADGVGDDAAVAEGIAWATDHGARVINMSLYGEEATCSRTLSDAVEYAWARGVILVAASGNRDDAVGCPASLPHVIAVGSVDEQLVRAASSNYGPQLRLVAPGVRITSTVPLTVDPSGFGSLSGTSMATPVVSAAVALVRTFAPALTPAQVADLLARTARDLGPPGRDEDYGYGIVDAGAAVRASAELASGSATVEPAVALRDPAGLPVATAFNFTAAVPVTAAVRVEREDGTPVRELFAGPIDAGPASFSWDGLEAEAPDGPDGVGPAAPDGWYRFRADLEGPAGRTVTLTAPVGVSAALASTAVKPATFSPDGDGRYETVRVSWQLEAPAHVTVTVLDGSGRNVRTLIDGSRPAGPDSVVWDGRIGSRLGAVGRYTVAVAAATDFGTFELRREVTLDLRGMVATGLGAGAVYPVRDGYRDTVALRFRLPGRATVAVLLYRPGATSPFSRLAAGTLAAGSRAVTWNGRDAAGRALAAGRYTFRVQTRDPAGIVRVSSPGAVTVSAKRIVRATASATRPGLVYADSTAVSDPADADIVPSPVFADGVRLVVTGAGASGASPAWAAADYGFTLPAATVATALSVSVRYEREGPVAPTLRLSLSDTYVYPLRLDRASGTATLSIPTETLAKALARATPITLAVQVRLAGTGRVDVASITVRYAYGVLR